MGRQPWAVFGLMTTASGVSPSVSTGEVLTSLIVFTLLYGVLAVVEVRLMLTYIRRGADPRPGADRRGRPDGDADQPARVRLLTTTRRDTTMELTTVWFS